MEGEQSSSNLPLNGVQNKQPLQPQHPTLVPAKGKSAQSKPPQRRKEMHERVPKKKFSGFYDDDSGSSTSSSDENEEGEENGLSRRVTANKSTGFNAFTKENLFKHYAPEDVLQPNAEPIKKPMQTTQKRREVENEDGEIEETTELNSSSQKSFQGTVKSRLKQLFSNSGYSKPKSLSRADYLYTLVYLTNHFKEWNFASGKEPYGAWTWNVLFPKDFKQALEHFYLAANKRSSQSVAEKRCKDFVTDYCVSDPKKCLELVERVKYNFDTIRTILLCCWNDNYFNSDSGKVQLHNLNQTVIYGNLLTKENCHQPSIKTKSKLLQQSNPASKENIESSVQLPGTIALQAEPTATILPCSAKTENASKRKRKPNTEVGKAKALHVTKGSTKKFKTASGGVL